MYGSVPLKTMPGQDCSLRIQLEYVMQRVVCWSPRNVSLQSSHSTLSPNQILVYSDKLLNI